MSRLTRRAQSLLDQDEYRQLELRAAREQTSVGALVRAAVAKAYGVERDEAWQAGQRFLEAELMPVEDWQTMKESMLAEWGDPRARS